MKLGECNFGSNYSLADNKPSIMDFFSSPSMLPAYLMGVITLKISRI